MAKNGQPKYERNPSGSTGMGAGGKYTRSRRAFEWASIDRATIGQLVTDVCDTGNGLVLGRTSDGGALSITILRGEERIREWPASVEDFLTFATWCSTNLGSVSFDGPDTGDTPHAVV